MKRTLLPTLFLVSILLPSTAIAEEITVTVKGMVCSFCAQGIKKTFGKREGVEKVNVDLDSKVVTVKIREGAAISDEEIRSAITDAGYDVASIERGTGEQ